MASHRRLRFRGSAADVELIGCADLPARLAPLMAGWEIDAPQGGGAIVVEAVAAGWRIHSPWTPEPATYDEPADIACALFADLIMAYAAAAPRLLCLHAGAVRIGHGEAARLVVFPAQSHGGKSTLAGVLALQGTALYSDDVLPIDLGDGPRAGHGVALGLAPRPRLPWPAGLRPATRAALAEARALASDEFAYLALPPGGLAPLGEACAIGHVVRLERGDGPGELAPASRGDVMKLLLWQNFGNRPPAAELVARFAALTAQAGCWRLRYREADEAAELLWRLPPPGLRAAS